MTTDIILNDHYLIVVSLSLFFSAISIAINVSGYKQNSENIFKYGITSLISCICWFITGIIHVAVSPTTSPLFMLSYLYFGFGVVFAIVTIIDVMTGIKESNKDAYGGYGKNWKGYNKRREEI
jgi:uncharacterized protein with PQ loop repeat